MAGVELENLDSIDQDHVIQLGKIEEKPTIWSTLVTILAKTCGCLLVVAIVATFLTPSIYFIYRSNASSDFNYRIRGSCQKFYTDTFDTCNLTCSYANHTLSKSVKCNDIEFYGVYIDSKTNALRIEARKSPIMWAVLGFLGWPLAYCLVVGIIGNIFIKCCGEADVSYDD
jgi:hypothetical protein